jgi:hypothetical protein
MTVSGFIVLAVWTGIHVLAGHMVVMQKKTG